MQYIFVFILSCFFIIGCENNKILIPKVTPGVTDSEIIIGSSSALSGHAGFLGTQYIHGALAYINAINENGGVHGRQIRLISYDDQYDPPQTIANTQKLINQDKVFMLFNYVGTPTSVKIIDIVHNAKVPVLGFFTGAEELRSPYRPYMFHVRDSYYSEAEGAVSYFVDFLGLSKLAVLYQEDAFGLTVLSGIQLALDRRSMDLVSTATYKRGSMDVEESLNSIKSSGAEAVLMVGTYSPLAKFIKLCRDVDYKPYFHTVSFVGEGAFANELIKTQKVSQDVLDKIIVTQVVPSPRCCDKLKNKYDCLHSIIPEYIDALKKYYPYDRKNFVSLEGFFNAKVLVEGLKRAGRDLTREKFILAIESIKDWNIGIDHLVSYDFLDHEGLSGIYYTKINKQGYFDVFYPVQDVKGKNNEDTL